VARIGQNPPMLRNLFIKFITVAIVLGLLVAPAFAQDRYKVGLADLYLKDPVDFVQITAIIAYPTEEVGVPTQIVLFTVAGARRTKIAEGKFPLVVFSHSGGGSRLDNHDSMTALARAGFVTATVEHPRDNFRDQTAQGSDRQLIGRSHHVKALIDEVLKDPNIGPSIDRTRIGVAGFSTGAYTALLTVGAKPNFALIPAYAKAVPNDPASQVLMSPTAQRRRPGFEAAADPRVRAAYLMAPLYGFLFDKAGLANIKVPIRLYRAGKDILNHEPYAIDNLVKNLPTPPDIAVAEGMGHYVFFTPCEAELLAAVPFICQDEQGVDRVAFHDKLNADMLAFFRRTLGVTN
jgi:predicted dienelactone hydrolase